VTERADRADIELVLCNFANDPEERANADARFESPLVPASGNGFLTRESMTFLSLGNAEAMNERK